MMNIKASDFSREWVQKNAHWLFKVFPVEELIEGLPPDMPQEEKEKEVFRRYQEKHRLAEGRPTTEPQMNKSRRKSPKRKPK
jgi:hypothetical protein